MGRTTTPLAGALLAGALLVTACSGDPAASQADPMGSGRAGSSGTSAGEHPSSDAADIAFARGMVPHHQQAVEMSRMARERAADPRVLDLAGRIEAAQRPELETLTGWLEEWGAASTGHGGTEHGGTDHGGTDHGGTEHGGMMSAEDMSALMAASGAEFDRLFLRQMIEHHIGAVEMAAAESAEGRDPGAIAMARTIRDAQIAEIAEMERLLTDLGG